MIDDHELKLLGAEFKLVLPAVVATESAKAIVAGAATIQAAWKRNATESAGKHGRLYPTAITSTVSFHGGTLGAEIGPDASLPQGGMSFENGSVNQPPHLDGARAADAEVPKIEAAIAALVDRAVGHA